MTEQPEKSERRSAPDNVVFIGRKPTMAYVMAVLTQLNEKGQSEIRIRARGKAISMAVDVAEIVKNKFMKELVYKDIKIGTEELENENKEKLNVSTIDLVLGK